MKRIVLELDEKLCDGELLLYKGGKIKTVKVHDLLPDLKKAKKDIAELREEISELKQTIANLAKIVKEK